MQTDMGASRTMETTPKRRGMVRRIESTMRAIETRAATCRFRVKLRGRPAGSMLVAVYIVVADEVEEAMRLAMQYEPSPEGTMALDECDWIENADGSTKGVEAVLARFEVKSRQ